MILQIRNNEIVNKGVLKQFFDQLKKKDGRYSLKAERINKRSNQQNRYVWGLVYEMVLQGFRDLGWDEVQTTEDVHLIMKARFLKITRADEQGEVIEIFRSTTSLSKLEFCEYVERIQQFAAQNLNIVIPNPGEQSALWE